jgi:hypothetical protein
MSDITKLSRLINGLHREVDTSANTLVVDNLKAKLGSAFSFTFAGTLTANRTITMPDANVDLTLVGTAIQKDGSVAFTADQSLGSHKLTNVLNPTAAQDAATKNYVDTAVSGLGTGTVTSVTSANTDISVATTTTTPVLTLNSGTGASQIVKRNASSQIDAATQNIINVLDPAAAQDAATKNYVDVADTLKANTNLGNLAATTSINSDLNADALTISSFRDVGTLVPFRLIRSVNLRNTAQIYTLTGDFTSGSNQITNVSGTLPTYQFSGYYSVFVSGVVGFTTINTYNSSTLLTMGANATATATTQTFYLVAPFAARSDDIAVAGQQSGSAAIRSGNVTTGASGTALFQTGNATGTAGISGALLLNSGNTTTGASGSVLLKSGNSTSGGNSGANNLGTGTVTTGTSGDINVNSGNASGAAGISGAAKLFSGSVTTGTSGITQIFTGLASGSGNSGSSQIFSGTATTGNTGDINIFSGNSTSGSTGNINLFTGSTSGTKGLINVQTSIFMSSNKITSLLDPTNSQDAATKNYVDTSISTSASTKANVSLNNISGSAVNADINAASDLTINLGSASLRYASINVGNVKYGANIVLNAATATLNDSTAVQSINFGIRRAYSASNSAVFDYSAANLDVLSNKIVNVATPTAANDATNKAYVDNLVAGLTWKNAVIAASVANVTISSAPASIDGVTLTSGDRVLLKDQSTASQNGIYIFNGTGSALTRSTDMDSWTEVWGSVLLSVEGTVNAGAKWVNTNSTTGTLGTTAIGFTAFSVNGTVNGTGTAGQVTYWTGSATLAGENFLATSRGGLGVDSSAFTGVLKFAAGVASASSIVNADINAAAAIAYSKLALSNSITASDLTTGVADQVTITGGNGTALSVQSAPAIKSVEVAGETLAANVPHVVRYAKAADSGFVAGRVYLADQDATTSDNFYAIGVTYSGSSTSAGSNITVTESGILNVPSHGFSVIGMPVYLTASGALSQTAPTTANFAIVMVGIVKDANNIKIDIKVVGVN